MYRPPHPRNGNGIIYPQVMRGHVRPYFLYGVHITLDAGAVAFRYDRRDGTYSIMDLQTLAGNQLELPLYAPSDTHYAIACGVGPNVAGDDDVIHYVGNSHDGQDTMPTKFHHAQVNGAFWTTPGSWVAGAEPGAALDADTVGTYCYHLFERRSDGTMLWAMSQSESRVDARGRDWLAFKKAPGAGWTPLVGDGHFATTVEPGTGADRVYLIGLYVEGPREPHPNRVHVAGNWRLDNVEADSSTAPWYVWSDDLTTWRDVRGGVVTMPLTWDDPNRAAWTIDSAPAFFATVVAGVFVDPVTGYPAIITRTGTTASSGYDDRTRLAWNGSAWTSTVIPKVDGDPIELWIDRIRYRRVESRSRMVLDATESGAYAKVGGNVPTTGENFTPGHCPVLLREEGVYAVNIGDGDTPKVYTWGRGARL